MKKFSLLMSVYGKDCPKLFHLALKSILDSTIQPTEVVLVKDGPIDESLEDVIDYFSQHLNLRIVKFNKNRGLHHALNHGLKMCSYDLVIRADADDVNEKNRFKILLQYSNKYDLVGSYIREYRDYFKTKHLHENTPTPDIDVPYVSPEEVSFINEEELFLDA